MLSISKRMNESSYLQIVGEQDFFRSIFNYAGVGMVVLDASGNIDEANPALEKFLALEPGQGRGKGLFSFAHPSDMAEYSTAFQAFQNGGIDKFTLDGKFIREDGVQVWGRLTVTPLKGGAHQSAFRAIGLMENITQKRIAQQRLAESEEKFRSLVRNLPGITYRCANDKDWTMDFISEGVETITGYPAADFLAPGKRTFASVIHPDDRALAEKAVEDGLATSDNFQIQYRVIRSNGETAWVFEKGLAIRGANGEVKRLDGFIMDITAQIENMRKIEEQQLQMLAASKLSSLGQMSAGIAHEVNNPLAIIHGEAAILKSMSEHREVDHQGVQRAANVIESTALRISRIVKALKSFAREGEKDPVLPCHIPSLIDETLEFCRERFKIHGIELRLDIQGENLTVPCRSVQISQVLVNLLNNAFDAVEDLEQKEIWVGARDIGRGVEIFVCDSSLGVAPEIRPQILMPFFTTKEIGRGTGLGLSISAGIVEDHHGSLYLDESATLTKFVIYLPRSEATA